MANKSDKRVASENAATLRLLKYGTATTQGLQLLLLVLFQSQRTRSHIALYVLTSLPSLFLTFQLISMGSPKTTANGTLLSAGDDLSQAGLTQYMMDVVFVTWASQIFACVWGKAWWLYASIPAFAAYKIFSLASPYIFKSLGSGKSASSTDTSATSATNKENLSKRQQKMQARYDKGDRRVQMGQR